MKMLNPIISIQQLENYKNFQYNNIMTDIKYLQQIAKQILDYEDLLQHDQNNKIIQDKIENIVMSLSLEDALLLDEIIQNKNF